MQENPPNPHVPTLPDRQVRKSSFGGRGWIIAVIAAITAVVLVYLAYHSFQLQHQLDVERGQITALSAQAARAQKLMDALTSPQAKLITLTETRRPAQPVAHASYVEHSGALVFIASNLRPIPSDKTYELWLIPAHGEAPIPAGLFRPDSTGAASVVLPPVPVGIDVKVVAVTIERAQGSPTPTLPIVMAGR